MNKIVEILNQIKSTAGKKDKEQILRNNKDDNELKEVLEFLYNPFIITGISTKKISKVLPSTDKVKETFSSIFELMQYLRENNTGKHHDIEKVQSYMRILDEEQANFVKELATKSLKIGITSKTLNKAFGKGFITEFNVMLAEKYFDNEHKVKGEFIITEKLDGSRAVIIKEDGKVKMFSRQGQPLLGFSEIEKEVELLPDNIVLDGEFILKNDKNLNSADLFRATMKVVRKDGDKTGVVFHAFDTLPLEDFKNGICTTPCIDRKMKLANMIDDNFKFIGYVPTLYLGENKEEINKWLDVMIIEGKEGVMVNLADSPYKCKRCSDILKVKKMHTADLRIIGFEEGEGKYKGTMGRMNVNYKGFSVGVGSGFKDEDRQELWNNQDEYMGKIAEIQYFEESSNQNGGISLRFPVFKMIREDKSEESYN